LWGAQQPPNHHSSFITIGECPFFSKTNQQKDFFSGHFLYPSFPCPLGAIFPSDVGGRPLPFPPHLGCFFFGVFCVPLASFFPFLFQGATKVPHSQGPPMAYLFLFSPPLFLFVSPPLFPLPPESSPPPDNPLYEFNHLLSPHPLFLFSAHHPISRPSLPPPPPPASLPPPPSALPFPPYATPPIFLYRPPSPPSPLSPPPCSPIPSLLSPNPLLTTLPFPLSPLPSLPLYSLPSPPLLPFPLYL